MSLKDLTETRIGTGVLPLLPSSPHSAYVEIFQYFISLNEMALLATFTLAKIKSRSEKLGRAWITIKSSRVPTKLLQACPTHQ